MTAPNASSLLDYYHCTFFLPLLGFGEGVPEPGDDLRRTYLYDKELEDEDAQAFYYFTPTLRDIVFDRGDESQVLTPVREWALDRKIIECWLLELQPSPNQRKEINAAAEVAVFFQQEAVFHSVRLYRYFNGIYVLAFTVEPKALRGLRGQSNVSLFANPYDPDQSAVPQFWEAVTADDPNRLLYEKLQLESWLRFTRLARQLYPTFTEQGDENKIAPLVLKTPEKEVFALSEKVPRQLPRQAEHLSPIILHLVQAFFPEPVEAALKAQIRLFDDRMFVSVAYGLAGKKHEGDLHKIRTLLSFTDRFADGFKALDGYPYDKQATDQYRKDSEFELWAGLGGHFIFNDMVNAYLYNGEFFRNVIAAKHIPYIYDRMLLQVLFYQASLRHYDHVITTQTTALQKPGKQAVDAILKQRSDFIRFTNQYWFKEVTNQMQGKEIFRLQYKGVGVEAHYQQLQDEISRTNDYLQVLHENTLAEESGRFTKLAVVFAVAAYYIAALPVLNDQLKNEGLWTQVFDSLLLFLPAAWVAPVLGVVTVLLLPILLALVVYWWFIRGGK